MTTMHVPIFAGEGQIVYEDRSVPYPQQPTDVLVKIEACGICGTDLNILAVPAAHKATPGIILGHEGVGVVEEVGAGVRGLKPGDRVVIATGSPVASALLPPRAGQPVHQLPDDRHHNGRGICPYLRPPARALWKISRCRAMMRPLRAAGVRRGRRSSVRPFSPAITWRSSAPGPWGCSLPCSTGRWARARSSCSTWRPIGWSLPDSWADFILNAAREITAR